MEMRRTTVPPQEPLKRGEIARAISVFMVAGFTAAIGADIWSVIKNFLAPLL
jgi:hypothetical protein